MASAQLDFNQFDHLVFGGAMGVGHNHLETGLMDERGFQIEVGLNKIGESDLQTLVSLSGCWAVCRHLDC